MPSILHYIIIMEIIQLIICIYIFSSKYEKYHKCMETDKGMNEKENEDDIDDFTSIVFKYEFVNLLFYFLEIDNDTKGIVNYNEGDQFFPEEI